MFSPQFIKDYITEKLKEDYRISSNNREMIIPSVFIDNDYKRHMSINLETGLWQCFKRPDVEGQGMKRSLLHQDLL